MDVDMMDFSYVAEDPSGATDCTTHGINKDLYFVYDIIYK